MEEVVFYLGLGLEALVLFGLIGYFGFKFFEFKMSIKITKDLCDGFISCMKPLTDALAAEMMPITKAKEGVYNDYLKEEIAKRTPVSMDDLEAEAIDDDWDSGE